MMRSRMFPVLCAFVLSIAGIPASAAVSASTSLAQSGPSLRFAHASGYTVGIAGRGWQPGARVVVTVRVEDKTAAIVLQATGTGTFKVGGNQISLCNRPIFDARSGNTHVVLHGPALGCPSQLDPPVPSLSVLQGKPVQGHVLSLSAVPGGSIVLHVGDILLLGGSSASPYVPSVNSKYLAIAPGAPPIHTVCPVRSISCSRASYWRLVALRKGNTHITMTPGCRDFTPPCATADYTIAVHILRARADA